MPGKKRNKCKDHQLGSEEIAKYMIQRDIPDWFRGISKFQCAASSGLFEALLYDTEQRSTHRVKACLASLGLKPMVTNEQLKKLMKISRGSDLAFLWFLLEMHYKSKGPGYSINEQIIYSCIAHLDMVTTLRELDRLLPHNRPKKKKPSQKIQQQVIVRPTIFKQFKLPKNFTSPYLETIKTPKMEYRSIELKRPSKKVSLDEYEVYKDPNYIVRNESTRWFANYHPKLSKRIAGRILRDEIERILDNANEISKEIDNKLILCHHHHNLIEAEINRRCDIEKKACADITNYFDVDGKRELRIRKRITAQIERDVRMYMQKLSYDTKRIHSNQENKKHKIEILEGIDSIRYCEIKIPQVDQCKETLNEMSTFKGADVVDDDKEWGERLTSDETDRMSKVDLCTKISIPSFCDFVKNDHGYDCFFRGLCATSARHTTLFGDDDQNFFVANQKHKPYNFDYQKIFNIDHSMPTSEQMIKLKFVKALNSQMSISPNFNGNVDIREAFDTEFKKQWSKSVEEYNRKVDLESRLKKDIKEEEEEHEEEIPLRFDRENFDPNDKPYMVYMLKCCFDRMKKNPKFVLASLPDAHKIPILLYFIQGRYGKRYSFEERQRLFAESLRILRALEKVTKEAPVPKIAEFATAGKVSYGCRDYLLAKGEKFRQKYYDELDQIIMHEARIFWFSMRPYLRTSGPPRNTYFAYMPSSTVDLTRFRQWKPSEFMDAKKAWDRRQKQAKRF